MAFVAPLMEASVLLRGTRQGETYAESAPDPSSLATPRSLMVLPSERAYSKSAAVTSVIPRSGISWCRARVRVS